MLYGHSKNGVADKSQWQTLTEHLTGVSDLAARFAATFDAQIMAQAAGLLHDLGKADERFQKYMEKSALENFTGRSPVHHSEAGAAYAVGAFDKQIARILSNVIIGHHTGLPDFQGYPGTLTTRLENGKKELAALDGKIDAFLSPLPSDSELFPQHFKFSSNNFHFFVRFLFSCLVDADRLDTERFDNPEQYAQRPKFPSLEEYRGKFNSFMDALASKANYDSDDNSPRAILFRARNQILADCRKKGAEAGNCGIYSLAVPTGGGKTLSSMAFALEHAKTHKKDRIIYVIPYTSIIEQNADVFRNIFGAGNVVEHHSSIDWDKLIKKLEKDPRSVQQMELAAENWDAPLIVTTNVQFFETLFACQTGRCRKLHNIANSVVILDEAQMIKPELISVCNSAMNELAENFKTTFVLCTATQPALDDIVIEGEQNKYVNLKTPELINSNPNQLYEILRRVEFHIDIQTPQTWDSIADKQVEQNQVLCIVNTRKDCYELYNTVKQRLAQSGKQTEVFHLSALMCSTHRTERIEQIKERLKENLPVCVISTQLVEAGVDIDFPVVYRAKAGLDSILQSAGRCNREGKLPGLGQMFVFLPPSKIPTGLMTKAAGAFNEIWDEKPDIQNPDVYRNYSRLFFNSLDSTRNIPIKETRQQVDVLDELCKDPLKASYRTIGENLQWIDDDYSVSVAVCYEKGKELIRLLKIEGPHRDLMRKLQRYMVNIPQNKANELLQSGALFELECGIVIQNINNDDGNNIYDYEYGLNIFNSAVPIMVC